MNSDINTSINKINKLYDKLTYFDLYGSSVLAFIIITIIVFLVYSYSIVMLNASIIKDDWVNQRCNPTVIPFAGIINKPDNQSIVDFTGNNFSFCIQSILTTITGFAVQPFNFLVSFLSGIFNDLKSAINIIRDFLANIRSKFREIAENILSRILNMLIPIQRIFIAMQDSFAKSQAILTAGLYTTLGAYLTLQSLLGAIAELIIIILIALAVVIIGLWIIPFTFPVAASMTIIFISIAIPLTIIVLFMTQVLHIQTEGVPGVPSCLDKNTKIQMNDFSFKKIKDIKLGDCLFNNNIVTAKIKVTSNGQKMYNLNGIKVSGTHIVNYNSKWIKVKDHPNSILIKWYMEPYLYCLNTTNKNIIIKDLIFTDWDELYDHNLEKIISLKIYNKTIEKPQNIHYYLDNGFIAKTKIQLFDGTIKYIKDIKIGDELLDNNIIYGLVKIDGNKLFNKHLGDQKKDPMNDNKLYHLLTKSKTINIESKNYSDYNSLVDSNL